MLRGHVRVQAPAMPDPLRIVRHGIDGKVTRAYTVIIPAAGVGQLSALVVEPDLSQNSPILLFLHGGGEAGSSLGALPLVCVHQTPPFQAMLGHLPGTLVIAPQAPPIPNSDDWNWRDYARGLAEFLANRYTKRRIVATGFSRGGLGVLQLISTYPDLVQAWGVVDPQPPRDREEMAVSSQAWRSPREDGFDTVNIATGATRGRHSALCSAITFPRRTETQPNCPMSKWQCRRTAAPR